MTEQFTISSDFDKMSADILWNGVKKSKLTEGINIVRWHEYKKAKKPFIVVVYTADAEDVVKVFKAGAQDCVKFSLDPKEMTRRFDRK